MDSDSQYIRLCHTAYNYDMGFEEMLSALSAFVQIAKQKKLQAENLVNKNGGGVLYLQLDQ